MIVSPPPPAESGTTLPRECTELQDTIRAALLQLSDEIGL